jgi:BON domain
MLRLRKLGVGRVGWRWIGLLSLLAVGTNGCSRGRRNSEVASDVQNRIRSDGRMQMARVQVLANNGVVALSGYVTSSEQRVATVQDAAQTQGVRVVIDNLRILDLNPQTPAAAMQKPSAAIARSVSPPTSRPAAPIIPKVDAAPAIKPEAPADRPPVAQTIAVSSAKGPATSPVAAPVPATPERHAISSKAPDVGASVVPVSVLAIQPPARPVPPPEPERVTVPNGTELVVRLTESLSSDLNEKGDTFLASLASPIMIGDRVVIPAEAGVEGKVIDVQTAGRFSGRPRVAVQMTRLTYNGKTYELRSSQYSKQGASRDARSLAAIGGGAGVGAIIGGILGGGRGAAIGSVIGAGAGTSAQAASKAPQVKLPAETVLNFRLQAPLTVIPSSTLQRARNTGPGSPQDPFSSDDDRPVLKRRPDSPPTEPDAPDATQPPDNK